MSGSWWARIVFILSVFLLAIYVLLPTFVGEDARTKLQAQVAEQRQSDSVGTSDPETSDPAATDASNLEAGADAEGAPDEAATKATGPTGWRSYLPDTKINLGLDLQGGIDLTLEVDVDEAINTHVARKVPDFLGDLRENGYDVADSDVEKVRGEPTIKVRKSAGLTRKKAESILNPGGSNKRWKPGEVKGDWVVFKLAGSEKSRIATSSVEQALEGLRTRVNATGVKEPSIVKRGNDINIQLPGIDNLKQAVAVIGTTAVLEFFMVDEEFEISVLDSALIDAEAALTAIDAKSGEAEYLNDRSLNDWLIDQGVIGDKRVVYWEYEEKDGKKVRTVPHVLKTPADIGGDDINDAFVQWNQFGEAYVSLDFTGPGGKKFARITGANVGKRFAIVLDKKVRSAPVIREKIAGGRAQISMGQGSKNSKQDEAQMLSMVLRTGALPAPVTPTEYRVVGAQLGADSVRQGVRGTLVGAFLVLVFMFLYYRSIGFVANLALTMNVIFILALLATLGATLTLPGIAGIALTVGMAVDANIIIYERIREELRLGKTARAAVDAGFDNGFSAVMDANVTTAIAGVVLYSYGTGPIKGFAVTLLIGIVTTLFTAIFVSRTFMDFVVRKSTTRLAL